MAKMMNGINKKQRAHARFQAGRAAAAPVDDYDEINSDEEEDSSGDDEAVEVMFP
jgi:hypothetical protein